MDPRYHPWIPYGRGPVRACTSPGDVAADELVRTLASLIITEHDMGMHDVTCPCNAVRRARVASCIGQAVPALAIIEQEVL